MCVLLAATVEYYAVCNAKDACEATKYGCDDDKFPGGMTTIFNG